VISDYFPANIDDAVKYFSAGPLARPRAALVRNFVIVLTKLLLTSSMDEQKQKRFLAALLATIQLHRGISHGTLADKLNEIIIKLPDAELPSSLFYLYNVKDTWQYLGEDSRNRLKNYVRALPTDNDENSLFYALKMRHLTEIAVERIKELDHTKLANLISLDKENIHPAFVQRAIELYKDSGSFAEANAIGSRLIIPLAKHIPANDVEGIIRACAENGQIRDSFERGPVLSRIRKSEIISLEEFSAFSIKYGLAKEQEEDDEIDF
jgi:hypothetical protein